jgi:hypothetical protein
VGHLHFRDLQFEVVAHPPLVLVPHLQVALVVQQPALLFSLLNHCQLLVPYIFWPGLCKMSHFQIRLFGLIRLQKHYLVFMGELALDAALLNKLQVFDGISRLHCLVDLHALDDILNLFVVLHRRDIMLAKVDWLRTFPLLAEHHSTSVKRPSIRSLATAVGHDRLRL